VSDAVDALQTALAAEHAVIWGYAVVGAHVSGELRGQVSASDIAHRGRRDLIASTVRRLGADPALTAASYALPFPVTDQPSALRLAVHLEEGVAASWRYVVAATDDRFTRRTAIAALSDAAVRATGWRQLVTPGALTVPFPGDSGS
jgi:hypothetical protein